MRDMVFDRFVCPENDTIVEMNEKSLITAK